MPPPIFVRRERQAIANGITIWYNLAYVAERRLLALNGAATHGRAPHGKERWGYDPH